MAKTRTSFKPGNKAALGNPNSGAPEKYDLNKEAEDLLNWSDIPSSTTLYDFTDKKEYLAEQLCQFAKRSAVFASALKKAKERIGRNRERKCSDQTMNYGVWNRSASLYDPMLRSYERDEKDRELDRKLKSIDYEYKKKADLDKSLSVPPNEKILQLEDENIKLRNEINELKKSRESPKS